MDEYLGSLPLCKVCGNVADECSCGDDEYTELVSADDDIVLLSSQD